MLTDITTTYVYVQAAIQERLVTQVTIDSINAQVITHNVHKPRLRTNIGKWMISFKVIYFWKKTSAAHFKELSVFAFSKPIKH